MRGPGAGTAAEAAQARLASQLRDRGQADSAVASAFLAVPRHLFLPGVAPPDAYQDTAFVIKSDADGLPVSASTQPVLMAAMLGQLGLAAGHRVLEIGTGSGYNAALIARLVGEQELVTTVEADPELAGRARVRLAAAGYGGVRVICGDGSAGVPEQAPYDRIIVTAGAWDLAPAWLTQLARGGRIVLPLSVRGIQLSAALERAGHCWTGRAACRCRFVNITGAAAGQEQVVPLGPQPGLHAQVADGPVPDAGGLFRALTGSATELPAGLSAASIAELADLDLWLTLTEPGLTRLNLMGRHEGLASPAQQRIAGLMPLGGLARPGNGSRIGVAAVTAAGGLGRPGPYQVVARGYGQRGPALAGYLARRAATWHRQGRPGVTGLELSAWPPAGPAAATRCGVVIDRPHVRLMAGWPAPGQRPAG